MKHVIDTAVLQEVLNYLASRPFAEVAQLINKIQNSAKAEEGEAEASSQDQAVS